MFRAVLRSHSGPDHQREVGSGLLRNCTILLIGVCSTGAVPGHHDRVAASLRQSQVDVQWVAGQDLLILEPDSAEQERVAAGAPSRTSALAKATSSACGR